MIGRYLGEFSITYKPTRHGKAGVGATKGSAHTALKWSLPVRSIAISSIISKFIYNINPSINP
jgi:hypothetical protein